MNSPILRVFITIVFLASLPLVSSAQTRKDVVYLKNGSIIKGIILEMIPNATIKIETTDGSIFVFKMDEVEKTEKSINSKN